jgi:hypothetical protein
MIVPPVVLGRGPLQRHPLAGPLLQRRAIGVDRLLQPLGAALPLAERQERVAEVVLGRRPSCHFNSSVTLSTLPVNEKGVT